jgi:hypothetical protein
MGGMSSAIATTLSALAVVGALSLPALTCVSSDAPRLLRWSRFAAYGLGSLVCHQKTDRSFRSCDRQWPVCGRCTGLYLGAAAGVLTVAAGWRRRASARTWRRSLAAAAAPTAVLWVVEIAGLWDPGTPIRAAVASGLGLAGGMWLASVARGHLR